MLTPRYAAAVHFAVECHADQVRKGTTVPYVSHPISTSAKVFAFGGDEDQAIAALLHDVVEDCGVEPWKIGALYGGDVQQIVEDCTDGVPGADGKKLAWKPRKTAYILHLREGVCDRAVLVSICDKMDNLEAIERDIRVIGEKVWDKFSAPKREQRWYFTNLLTLYEMRLGMHHPAVMAFRVLVNRVLY